MIRLAKYLILGIGGIVVLALAWYVGLWLWLLYATYSEPRVYHYRLTLTVDTPEGERIGSNVVEVRYEFPAASRGVFTRVSGEATIVDLGSRGILFALLRADSERGLKVAVQPYAVGLAPFPASKFGCDSENRNASTDEFACYVDNVVRRKPRGQLSLTALPLLVRFRDTNEPASVERVDPSNLAASFGAGVSLKSAYVEITNDPVTRSIVQFLPWLGRSDLAPSLFPPGTGASNWRAGIATPQVEELNYNDFREFVR